MNRLTENLGSNPHGEQEKGWKIQAQTKWVIDSGHHLAAFTLWSVRTNGLINLEKDLVMANHSHTLRRVQDKKFAGYPSFLDSEKSETSPCRSLLPPDVCNPSLESSSRFLARRARSVACCARTWFSGEIWYDAALTQDRSKSAGSILSFVKPSAIILFVGSHLTWADRSRSDSR